MENNKENELYLEPSVEVSGDALSQQEEPVIICVSGC
jgi:hypothetical protein